MLLAIDRGHLTSNERVTIQQAHQTAERRARLLNPSISGPPTALEFRAELRRMGHRVDAGHAKKLAEMAGLTLADR